MLHRKRRYSVRRGMRQVAGAWRSQRLAVELLEDRRLLASDLGDAPAPFPTLLVDGGAQHEAIGPMLGSTRDDELDGQPSASADGDGVDEDGVTFGSVRVGQVDAVVTVNVQNAPAGARLDAWIDFDHDGNWGGRLEQIADGLELVEGDNIVMFDVPSWTASGATFARFRVSTTGDLGIGGAAADGEVEDYQLTIDPPVASGGVFSSPKPVAEAAGSIFTSDVDQDGDVDVISGSSGVWHENDGDGNFTTRFISTDSDFHGSAFAGDVDGDGDIDILVAAATGDAIALFENDGNQNFAPVVIADQIDSPNSVSAADVDRDGDVDVLAISIFSNEIVWLENQGGLAFLKHTISTEAFGGREVFPIDVDRDGDIDVLSISDDGDVTESKIEWHENDGNQNFTTHLLTTAIPGVKSIFGTDLDSDDDVDIVIVGSWENDGRIVWFENDGNENYAMRAVSLSLKTPASAFVSDLDGDGDLDILTAILREDKIAWYENTTDTVFAARIVSATATFPGVAKAADIDGDGDLDVVGSFSGMIAWYENLTPDFGDAPAPYPTLLDDDGPRHEATGPRLGAARDMEPEGQPSPASDGDGSDDDGVTFDAIHVGQIDAVVTVNVHNAPEGAKLDAWIDFDGDGSWGGSHERIAYGLPVVEGDNLLSFDVPGGAVSGQTYARFRLSTVGELGVIGEAFDGEVEDYQLTIDPPAAAEGAFFDPRAIATDANGAESVHAIDLDGDGDTDAVSASSFDGKIAWYENDGDQTFTTHTISTSAPGASAVYAVDVDGDGDVDLLAASAGDDTIRWYENDGTQSFAAHVITTAAAGARDVLAVDVDDDGDLDVVSASQFDDTVAWYENDGNQSFTPHVITDTALGAASVLAADVDGDGDLDILSASADDDTIRWYENDSSQDFQVHLITTMALGVRSVDARDVDGDGDIDVLTASADDDSIRWYENDGDENFTPHLITSSATGASDASFVDIDGDGDIDVLASAAAGDAVSWFENDGSQNFTAHFFSTTSLNVQAIFAADVDGDGDLDVLSASRASDTIAWHENLAPDFGDAPAPFPTLLADGGPRHETSGPQLGSLRDSEADGQPDADADGDGEDEDGITFGTVRVGQTDTIVTVNVQNAPEGARLDAWIDFDGDSNWQGTLEQIADSVEVVEGDNVLMFDVPGWAMSGTSYARFRLSTAGDFGLGGVAADGEVEDHALVIEPPAATDALFSEPNPISGNVTGQGVFVIDLDGDGDADVISAQGQFGPNSLTWHENDGNGGFITHVISDHGHFDDDVAAADFDNDGDLDIIRSQWGRSALYWYENDGDETFTEHLINSNTPNARSPQSVRVADIDGDGDVDVVVGTRGSDGVQWLDNDGHGNFETRLISLSGSAYSMAVADVDRDGLIDIVAAHRQLNQIIWHRNNGDLTFTELIVDDNVVQAHGVAVADLEGDGTMDILAVSLDDQLLRFVHRGDGVFSKQLISTTINHPRAVFAADVDGDGDMDVLTASESDTTTAWYEYDGVGRFTEHVIDDSEGSPQNVTAADMDGDGDLDVVMMPENGRLSWYENMGQPAVVGRHVFYNDSAYDGEDPAINALDDNAIDPSKVALLPGETATFANYVNYTQGINGIIIDIANVITTPQWFHFVVLDVGRLGNAEMPTPSPNGFTVRPGAGVGGSDRVTLTWNTSEGPVFDTTWARVLVSTGFGLPEPDVFYFGSAPGEGSGGTFAQVGPEDELGARNNLHGFGDFAAIDDPWDYNKDRLVDVIDQLFARNNQTGFLDRLELFTGPVAAPLSTSFNVRESQSIPLAAGLLASGDASLKSSSEFGSGEVVQLPRSGSRSAALDERVWLEEDDEPTTEHQESNRSAMDKSAVLQEGWLDWDLP
ncbi:MAG: VCBS repeat-containing protein [Pirellulales bacterium]